MSHRIGLHLASRDLSALHYKGPISWFVDASQVVGLISLSYVRYAWLRVGLYARLKLLLLLLERADRCPYTISNHIVLLQLMALAIYLLLGLLVSPGAIIERSRRVEALSTIFWVLQTLTWARLFHTSSLRACNLSFVVIKIFMGVVVATSVIVIHGICGVFDAIYV